MNVEIVFKNILNEYKEKRIESEIRKFISVKELKKLSQDDKRNIVIYCFQQDSYSQMDKFNVSNQLIYQLLGTPIFLSEDELLNLYEIFNKSKFKYFDPISERILLQISDFLNKGSEISGTIKFMLNGLKYNSGLSAPNRWNQKIDNILSGSNENNYESISLDIYFSNHGVLGNYLFNYFDKIDQNTVNLLQTLILEHEKSTPSKKWLKEIKLAIEAFDEERFVDFALGLFDHSITYLDDIVYKNLYVQEGSMRMSIMSEKNEDFVRSIVWAFSTCNFEIHTEKLIELAKWVYKKIPWFSVLQPRIGASLMYLFSQLHPDKSILIFGTLKKNTKYTRALKTIDKYISELALKSGKTKDQMEDENVPYFDLDTNGNKVLTFGNITAIIQVTSYKAVSLEWSLDQKSQKSVPTQMKVDHPEEWKALQKQVKEIKETLSAQGKRVESFFLADRTWHYADWCQVFHNHGLMSVISRSLIWEFMIDDKKLPLMYIEGFWKDENNDVVDILDQNPTVTLWHPINSTADTVMKWRQILQKYKIAQPIKQAYREIYIITEAEINTINYSNRFAAHILKNYQFGALCKLRNWRGFNQFHGGGTPELTIKQHKIKVQYYVDFAHFDNSGQFLSTDQVRFSNNNNQIDLIDVPRILFSEAMRDVDMFVGVCSIGNDPYWRDSGYNFGQDYWQSYSFGDLSEIAKTRREILEGILPKLKISKVSHIDKNFLIVKGKIRTYKIHMGSTNILMEPNNQYLCIVQDRISSSTSKLFIPFEGDAGLSIIISKALLLADDDKISDSSIVSQIKYK